MSKQTHILPRDFYLSSDVVQLGRDLLGKWLVTQIGAQRCAARIVETEAYRGPDDKACHAYGNRFTARTSAMFKAGGHAYVYLCYGIHHLFNIVTGPEGSPHAVLIRAVEPLENLDIMLKRRNFERARPQLCAGPGVLTKALGIHTGHSGLDLCAARSQIWLEEHHKEVPAKQIVASPRVGVQYAEECASWPWRFRIKGNAWTSPAK